MVHPRRVLLPPAKEPGFRPLRPSSHLRHPPWGEIRSSIHHPRTYDDTHGPLAASVMNHKSLMVMHRQHGKRCKGLWRVWSIAPQRSSFSDRSQAKRVENDMTEEKVKAG